MRNKIHDAKFLPDLEACTRTQEADFWVPRLFGNMRNGRQTGLKAQRHKIVKVIGLGLAGRFRLPKNCGILSVRIESISQVVCAAEAIGWEVRI